MRFNILNFAEYRIAVLMLVVLFHKGDKIVQNAKRTLETQQGTVHS